MKSVILSLLFSMLAFAQADTHKSVLVPPITRATSVPLSEALSLVGVRTQGGFISFGIAIYGREPIVALNWNKPVTLNDALEHIISQIPGYTYTLVSDHLVDVYPSSMLSDPNDPLNLFLEHVQIEAPAMDLFSNPSRFIPQLKALQEKGKLSQACGSIGPGLGAATTAIKLDLRRVTLKQVLDAAAIADATPSNTSPQRSQPPAGWILRSQIDPKTDSRENQWSFIVTTPRTWRILLKSPGVAPDRK